MILLPTRPGPRLERALLALLSLALACGGGRDPAPAAVPGPPSAVITPGWTLPAPPSATVNQSYRASVPAQPGVAMVWSVTVGSARLSQQTAATVTFTPTAVGALQLRCQVTDAAGECGLLVGRGPVLNAYPDTLTLGQSTFLVPTFSGAAGIVDPGGIPVTSGAGLVLKPGASTAYTLTVDGAPAAEAAVTVQRFTPRFVYVANNGSGISGFVLDPATGGLAPTPDSPYPGTPDQVVSDPQGRFLFASAQESGLLAYRIDPASGALTAVPGSPWATDGVATAFSTFSLAVDPQDRFVYASSSSRKIYGYSLDLASGLLRPVAGSPFATAGDNAQGEVLVHPSGQYLYAALANAGRIDAFAIDPDSGALTRLPNAPYDARVALPVGLAVDATGSLLFVKGEAPPSGLAAFQVDPGTGALSLVAGSPFPLAGDNAYHGLSCHPALNVLYTAFSDDPAADASAYAYAFAPPPGTGVLTPLAAAPYRLFAEPGSDTVTVDRSGQFAFATSWSEGVIARMRVDGAGALTRLDGAPLGDLDVDTAPVGQQPDSVTVAGTLQTVP